MLERIGQRGKESLRGVLLRPGDGSYEEARKVSITRHRSSAWRPPAGSSGIQALPDSHSGAASGVLLHPAETVQECAPRTALLVEVGLPGRAER